MQSNSAHLSVKLFCDGGSRGNPGPAASGFVLYDAQTDQELDTGGRFLGIATNNQAEYDSLQQGLQAALKLSASSIAIAMDSELIVKQINGQYKVKNATLRVVYQEVVQLLAQFDHWSIRHVYRADNKVADAIVNRFLDAAR